MYVLLVNGLCVLYESHLASHINLYIDVYISVR